MTVAVAALLQLPPAVLLVVQEGPLDAETLPGAAYSSVRVILWPGASINCTFRSFSVVQLTGIAVIEQPVAAVLPFTVVLQADLQSHCRGVNSVKWLPTTAEPCPSKNVLNRPGETPGFPAVAEAKRDSPPIFRNLLAFGVQGEWGGTT